MASQDQRQSEKLYRREYRKRNPEQGRAACKRWRERNKQSELARGRAKGKKYREANKEKQRLYLKRWRAQNSEKVTELTNRRRARKLSTQVDPKGISQWMRDIRAKPFVRCHWCGTKIHGAQIHFDHIVPLSKGGPHIISNLCACCYPCNSSKAARAIADWICNGQTFLPL